MFSIFGYYYYGRNIGERVRNLLSSHAEWTKGSLIIKTIDNNVIRSLFLCPQGIIEKKEKI